MALNHTKSCRGEQRICPLIRSIVRSFLRSVGFVRFQDTEGKHPPKREVKSNNCRLTWLQHTAQKYFAIGEFEIFSNEIIMTRSKQIQTEVQLTEAERQRFVREGYVIIRDLCPRTLSFQRVRACCRQEECARMTLPHGIEVRRSCRKTTC